MTFWGKRDLREVLKKALAALDEHYITRGEQWSGSETVGEATKRQAILRKHGMADKDYWQKVHGKK